MNFILLFKKYQAQILKLLSKYNFRRYSNFPTNNNINSLAIRPTQTFNIEG